MANSLRKIISQRSAFAFRSLARALAAGLPRQDHVYKTTDESFRFHNKKIDEMRCKLDSTENPRSFEKYPTRVPRNCAESCNSSVQKCTIVNAIVGTEIFQFLSVCIWSWNWAHLVFELIVPTHPQPRPFKCQLFLDFRANFSPEWPLNFWSSRFTPSNQAKSRYPQPSTQPQIKDGPGPIKKEIH